jgi:hypothetical protein
MRDDLPASFPENLAYEHFRNTVRRYLLNCDFDAMFAYVV